MMKSLYKVFRGILECLEGFNSFGNNDAANTQYSNMHNMSHPKYIDVKIYICE